MAELWLDFNPSKKPWNSDEFGWIMVKPRLKFKLCHGVILFQASLHHNLHNLLIIFVKDGGGSLIHGGIADKACQGNFNLVVPRWKFGRTWDHLPIVFPVAWNGWNKICRKSLGSIIPSSRGVNIEPGWNCLSCGNQRKVFGPWDGKWWKNDGQMMENDGKWWKMTKTYGTYLKTNGKW